MDLVRIKGYEDYYAINKAGQIYSFRRRKFLTPFKDRDGLLLRRTYYMVQE